MLGVCRHILDLPREIHKYRWLENGQTRANNFQLEIAVHSRNDNLSDCRTTSRYRTYMMADGPFDVSTSARRAGYAVRIEKPVLLENNYNEMRL